MSGEVLCFVFGFSFGYISKTVFKYKCSNNHHHRRRIHDVELPSPSNYNNYLERITMTQPQMAIPCHDNNIPLANTEAEQLHNHTQ